VAITLVNQSDLPLDSVTRDFVGEHHGGVAVSVLFVDAAPGQGPRLHRHPYVELLVILEGTALVDDGESKREVHGGQMAVVDANQPHGFVNAGTGRLKQIDIHLNPKPITEWLA
jgi:mannose-6-phosphate isomerase-like protein (cupin superfamily)